ncbi:MAG: DUF3465 domain-containing protein [Pseudomonadota bacterium]
MKKLLSGLAMVAIAVVAAAFGIDLNELFPPDAGERSRSATEQARQGKVRPSSGSGSPVAQAFADGASDRILEDGGRIVAVLSDDNEGSRHQRFIVEVQPGLTVLVAHNIDLAPRVARLQRGDRVTFKGEYEWTEKGGVVHWTHHDPKQWREGGWIEHEGNRYE